jgi:hypothetical protein
MAKTVSGTTPVATLTPGIGSRIIPSILARPMAGMPKTVRGISRVALPMAGMAINVRGISPKARPTVGMAINVRGSSTGMSQGGIINSIGGNSRPVGVSIIILVLLIIMPAIQDILNLPILSPIRQAIPAIPPYRRVRLARGPVIATPMPPGIPLCLKAKLLQG